MTFEHTRLGPDGPGGINLAVAGCHIPLVEDDVIRYQEVPAFAVGGNGVVFTTGGRRCTTDPLFAVAIFIKVELVASTKAVGKGHQLISLTDPVRIIGRAMTTLCIRRAPRRTEASRKAEEGRCSLQGDYGDSALHG